MEFIFLICIANIGLLAFFEPCTIATHTLFAIHTSRKTSIERKEEIVRLLYYRFILITILLFLSVLIFSKPDWEFVKPEIIFFVLGVVYFVSRYSYIPIPHLDFSKLLPRNMNEKYAIQLGLTLPACTIPLFIMVIGLTITINSFVFALIASLTYTIMFSSITLITIYKGVTEKNKNFLKFMAKTTPFITAFLFLLAGFLFIINRA